MASHAGTIDATQPTAADGRADEAPSRAALWATVSGGLEAFVEGAGQSGDGEACAARVGTWLQGRARLVEGDSIDRPLVEALIEAASTYLVYAGRDAGRVGEARHRFEDRSLGSLAPAASSSVGR